MPHGWSLWLILVSRESASLSSGQCCDAVTSTHCSSNAYRGSSPALTLWKRTRPLSMFTRLPPTAVENGLSCLGLLHHHPPWWPVRRSIYTAPRCKSLAEWPPAWLPPPHRLVFTAKDFPNVQSFFHPALRWASIPPAIWALHGTWFRGSL